jgi:hypothetical protein
VGVWVAVGVVVPVGEPSAVSIGVDVATNNKIEGMISADSGQLSSQDWISDISIGCTMGRIFGSVMMIF